MTQLRIKHNGALRHFIEVTPNMRTSFEPGAATWTSFAIARPSEAPYALDRWLAMLPSRIAQAAEQALAIERELFDKMSGAALENASALAP